MDALLGREHSQQRAEEVSAGSLALQGITRRFGASLAVDDLSLEIRTGELLALSGFINPYPGKLGVVEEGAFADLLLVDGNPLEDLSLVSDPDKNFLIIMKDGNIFKDSLAR